MISLRALKKICLFIAIEHALIISAAHAATITVTNTGDTDGNDQACTLREAIQSIHDLDTKSSGGVNVRIDN